MMTAIEVRTEVNRQYPGAVAGWARLDLTDGPVLARRKMAHDSELIYLLVVSGTGPHKMARHYVVTPQQELKSMAATAIYGKDLTHWVELVGLTRLEYENVRHTKSLTTQQNAAVNKYEHADSNQQAHLRRRHDDGGHGSWQCPRCRRVMYPAPAIPQAGAQGNR